MTKTYKIEGMSCGHCVMAVKKALSNLNLNVKNVEVGKAEIEYDENNIQEKEIINAIEEEGYKVVYQ